MKLEVASWLSFLLECVGVRVKGLGYFFLSCEKMENFSLNAYGYTLEKCVGPQVFSLAITEGSYGAFCPFTFLGESQKNS